MAAQLRQLREQGTAPGPVRSASVCAKYSEEHICVESDATDENDGKMGSLSLSLSISFLRRSFATRTCPLFLRFMF